MPGKQAKQKEGDEASSEKRPRRNNDPNSSPPKDPDADMFDEVLLPVLYCLNYI